ncbi:hypothetical protein [Nocardioides albus]|uniref:Uncharacterized protein n=1 Tax=Nocardioides albus TaxID=1841 RepID=A0A7W5A7K0_9ACTN|nr:hypothetical protein [Nocardioides albus]MBB3090930.1 hypothetical protein [Nocardioides albus]
MSLDLEDALRTSSDLTLDRSLAEIRTRGNRLRRRRTSLLTAAAAGMCLVVTGVVLAGLGRSPVATDLAPADQSTSPSAPEQVLTWSGEPTNVSDKELATLERSCLRSANQDAYEEANGWRMIPGGRPESPPLPDTIDPARLYPIFAERRADVGPERHNVLRAMFLTDDYLVHCEAFTTDSSQPKAEDAAGTASRIRPFPNTVPWEQFSSGWDTNTVNFMLPAPPGVTSVKFVIGDGYVDGTLNGGIAVAWLSTDGLPELDDDTATGFAAYDADGKRVGGSKPVPPKAWPVD